MLPRQTIEQPKRASGRSFASVVTRKRPSLNRAGGGSHSDPEVVKGHVLSFHGWNPMSLPADSSISLLPDLVLSGSEQSRLIRLGLGPGKLPRFLRLALG